MSLQRRFFFTFPLLLLLAAAELPAQTGGEKPKRKSADAPPIVTFVELGSVKCIPCRKMQPIMASIGKKYAGQVRVVFHDVWKSGEEQYAEKYGIRLIPTQVFLDGDGKEFFRHEGFFAESAIDTLLATRGVKPSARK